MAAPRQAGPEASDGSYEHQSFGGQVQNAGTLGNDQAECSECVRRGRARRVGQPVGEKFRHVRGLASSDTFQRLAVESFIWTGHMFSESNECGGG